MTVRLAEDHLEIELVAPFGTNCAPGATMAKGALFLLGTFRVMRPDGHEAVIRGAKTRALLARLALTRGQPVSRETLAGFLWSETDEDRARHSLRQTLLSVRSNLAEAGLDILDAPTRDLVQMIDDVEVDAIEFERLAQSRDQRDLERAIALYRGHLLDGSGIRDPDFEEWLNPVRVRLSGLASDALLKLARIYADAGRFEDAVEPARRLVAHDPLNEAGHRILIQSLARSGQRLAALRQAQILADLLRRELDIEPDEETAALVREIEAVRPAPAARPAERPPSPEPQGNPVACRTIGLEPFGAIGQGAIGSFAAGLAEEILILFGKVPEHCVVDLRPDAAGGGPVPQSTRLRLRATAQAAGQRIRVSAVLVDSETGATVWTERFERPSADLLAAQEQIAAGIVTKLYEKLGEGQSRAWSRSTRNIDAWLAGLGAMPLLATYSRDNTERARELLNEAVAIDPEFSGGWAALAWTYVIDWRSGWSLDSDLSLSSAESAIARARAIDPDQPTVRLVEAALLLIRGRHEEALSLLKESVEADPEHAEAQAVLGLALHFIGRDSEALKHVRTALKLCPTRPGWMPMADALIAWRTGDQEGARIAIERAYQEVPENVLVLLVRAFLTAEAGQDEDARRQMRIIRTLHPGFALDRLKWWLTYANPEPVDRMIATLRNASL